MRAKLGQHFLVDEGVLAYEAKCADARSNSVLEIGAGDGRLTARLLSCGAGHVTAVEFDPKLARQLRMRFAAYKRVRVHEGDFLEYDEKARFGRVVGNIPYYITSPILLKLSRMNFDKAVLCMQKEVAARMMAEPGSHEYGRLSVFSQLTYRAETLALVERAAFSPPPKVDSCIVSLVKTGFLLTGCEERAIGAIFSHKKKSVKNAVVDARWDLFGSRDRQSAGQIAQTLKYNGRKVFSLSPSEALGVARQLCAARMQDE
ncbi:MAG: 16S rRNA (adenine(1518)-N(6)/adenine(1519)-N(6))-dimethyltransferase RsmA [Candidatus Micrarchaeota archaeon]|nr:16S rRNA (adenine(1518)-N(6)/adenine(1519)-N(6))-dimethyltransferase RsmA [Candidatus Micrarchaeota archaeon]